MTNYDRNLIIVTVATNEPHHNEPPIAYAMVCAQAVSPEQQAEHYGVRRPELSVDYGLVNLRDLW